MPSFTGSKIIEHTMSDELRPKEFHYPLEKLMICIIQMPSGEWVLCRDYQGTAFFDFHNRSTFGLKLEITYNFAENISFTISNIKEERYGVNDFIRTDGSSTKIACINISEKSQEILNIIGGTLSTVIEKKLVTDDTIMDFIKNN